MASLPQRLNVTEPLGSIQLAPHTAVIDEQRDLWAYIDCLERLIEATGDAILTSDTHGRTLSWSRGAEQMLGWQQNDVLLCDPPFIPDARRQEWLDEMQRVLEFGEDSLTSETQRLTRDGRLIPVRRTLAAMRRPSGDAVGFLEVLRGISPDAEADRSSMAFAQLLQREAIARDLHDGLIQSLYGVVLGLTARARTLDGDTARTRGVLRTAIRQISAVIEEMRDYLFDLKVREMRPRDLTRGFEALVENMRANAMVEPELMLESGIEYTMDTDTANHVLYIARSAVSNVIRHADATSVRIQLERGTTGLVLTVRDDGRGFDPRQLGGRASLGLRNMAERAQLMGGRFEVSSQRGAGTLIRLEIPTRQVSEPE
jgi:PAS domain S-box-containing protein